MTVKRLGKNTILIEGKRVNLNTVNRLEKKGFTVYVKVKGA